MSCLQIFYNGQARQVAPGTSIAAFLQQLEIPRQYVAVELNQQLVPRSRHEDQTLSSGDWLEVVTLVGGG